MHLLAVVLSGLALITAQTTTSFRARLSVVPIDLPMQATIAGRGTVTAKLVGRTLTVHGEFSELKTAATSARLHVSPKKGIRGPAFADLTVAAAVHGSLQGVVELTTEQVEHLKSGRIYIQLQSEKAPDGNLWGWLLPPEVRR
jgi:hypothetical protein